MRRFSSMLVFAAVVAPALAEAQSGEQGSVCVHDFAAGLSCSGSAVSVAALTPVDIVDGCTSELDTATLTVDVVLSNAASNVFDVGMILALNGGSAESGGVCYHDFLDPPLTTSPSYPIVNGPWANLEPFDSNDQCGDMQASTQVTKTLRTPLLPLQITCADTNEDGNVDVSVCTSWRTGSTGPQATCDGLADAVPEAGQRCACARVEVLPEPGAAIALACGSALLAGLARGGSRSPA
jgi:hypothetical protein